MTTATMAPPANRPRLPHRPAPRTQPQPRKASPVAFGRIRPSAGHRIVLYGPGGIGKTSLACLAPGPVAFFDLDDSLGVLRGQLPPLDLRPVAVDQDWQAIRDALAAPGWDEVRTIVVDSATRAEELATAWVIENIPHEKGNRIERIEDYPYGKGYTHIYEAFVGLLGDLDAHARAGRHVILICHDCTSTVPNPAGEDWLRYEPRLQAPSSGKNSIRLRVREWADHVLFLGYDVSVEEGKATSRSCQTRTVYPTEQPHCMAKSRTLAEPVVAVRHDDGLWRELLGKDSNE